VEWLTSPALFERVPAPAPIMERHLFFLSRVHARVGRLRTTATPRRMLKAAAYPLGLARLDALLHGRAPGLLHVQWALLPPLDALLWRRWQGAGWRIVYTAHDVVTLPGTTPRVLADSIGRLFARADAVIAHSRTEADWLHAAGVADNRIAVVAWGGPGVFGATHVDQLAARQALGLPPNRPIVLFFGLLKPFKGLEVLLRGFPALRLARPDVRLVIAGEPMGARRAVERLIDRLGLGEVVDWRPGFVPQREVSMYFAAADVVALPYLRCSSSAVLGLAFAHARPVVATAVGALPELVAAAGGGVVVPAGDPAALASALAGLLADAAGTARLGRQAAAWSRSHQDWPAIGAATAALYERITAGQVARTGGAPGETGARPADFGRIVSRDSQGL
jgi:glycosyltransferase involved in cell wall biosynthesis